MKPELRGASIEVYRNISKADIFGGKNPLTVVAASILLPARALKPELTAENLADETKMAANTIKASFKVLWNERARLLPKSLVNHPVYGLAAAADGKSVPSTSAPAAPVPTAADAALSAKLSAI